MHRQGHGQLGRMIPGRKVNGAYSIINAPDDVHARQRKMFSHAFSERALRAQEPLMKRYIDLLISHLRSDARSGTPADVVAYFNFLAFDIIADLSFAAPLGALKDRRAHPWMTTFFSTIKIFTILMQLLLIPVFGYLIALVAWPLRATARRQVRFTRDKVIMRLEQGSERPDFMGAVLHNNERASEGEGITREEIINSFGVLMGAGTETTATLLSGCMYLLQRNQTVLAKLEREVRGSFSSEDEITLIRLNALPYLLAVLEESLRFYPPVPVALHRTTPPEGMSICGRWVPGNTHVGIPQLAAHHSPLNFVDHDKFVPERFLPDRDPKYDRDRRAVLQPFSAGPRNCLGRK
jgi:cytochrome P450